MTELHMNADYDHPHPEKTYHRTPQAVQILSLIFFAGFAISVSIVAIEEFWPAGIALAAYFAYQWGRIPSISGGHDAPSLANLRPQMPRQRAEATGNASFDAYRAELLERLEKEQADFETFLERLRDARDKKEFERFMDDRAGGAKPAGA